MLVKRGILSLKHEGELVFRGPSEPALDLCIPRSQVGSAQEDSVFMQILDCHMHRGQVSLN